MRIYLGILALCVSYVAVADKLKLKPDDGRFGAVVVALRIEDKCPSSVSTSMLSFEGILTNGKTTGGQWPIASISVSKHYETPPGRLVTQRLPVGQYRLTNFWRTSTGQHVQTAKDLDMYFEIKPGVVSYLGEVLFRITDCTTYEVHVKDEQVRDARMFDERIDDMESSTIVPQLISIPDELIGPQPSKMR
jgi:hypothetical protein